MWMYCSNGYKLRSANTWSLVLLAQYGANTSSVTGQAFLKKEKYNGILKFKLHVKIQCQQRLSELADPGK